MTTITFNQNIELSKTNFENIYDFFEEIEDYALGKIMEKNNDNKSYDISLLEQKYLGK